MIEERIEETPVIEEMIGGMIGGMTEEMIIEEMKEEKTEIVTHRVMTPQEILIEVILIVQMILEDILLPLAVTETTLHLLLSKEKVLGMTITAPLQETVIPMMIEVVEAAEISMRVNHLTIINHLEEVIDHMKVPVGLTMNQLEVVKM